MSPIPEYPGIRPLPVSTYTHDYGEDTGLWDTPGLSFAPLAPTDTLPQIDESDTTNNQRRREMLDATLREEVRMAVNEYLTVLMSGKTKSSQNNQDAPISTHDVMVAAKGAGQHASKAEAESLLWKFTERPNVSVKPCVSRDGRSSSRRDAGHGPPRSRTGSVGSYAGQSREGQNEEHWLVWKATPTPRGSPNPVPVPAAPRPATQDMRASPPRRARSVRSRASRSPGFTPEPRDTLLFSPGPGRATPTGDVWKGLTPSPSSCSPSACRYPRVTTPYPHYETPYPRHGSPYRQVDTPYPRVATPKSMRTDYHDNMSTPQVYPAGGARVNSRTEVTKYVPALNTWVASPSEQEKDAAVNLAKTLNDGMKTLKIHKVTFKNKSRGNSALRKAPPGGPSQLYQKHPSGVLESPPGARPYLDKNSEKQYLRRMARSMQQTEPSSHSYPELRDVPRPWPTHQARGSAGKDYIHENCVFQNSMPEHRSHFVIHPEWVSETGSRKVKIIMCTKGNKGIRYMAEST